MNQARTNLMGMKLATWAGPVLTALFFIGLIAFADFVPPPPPTASAAEITAFYVENLEGIRVGMVLVMIAGGLIAPWGVSLAVWTRRSEIGFPLLTYVQLVCVAVATLVAVLIPLMWGAAAFRPDDTSPDITRLLNDLGWFSLLFDWPPFVVWFVAFGLGVLWDTADEPAFPRWSAWFSLWVAFLTVPAGLMIFFKTGPLAFNGFLALYIPIGVFAAWILVMSVLSLQAIKRLQVKEFVAGDAHHA